MKRPSSLGGAFLEVILTVSFPGGGRSKIVSRIQKLRKEVALEPTDIVEVYFESLDNDKSICERVLHSQELYSRNAIGSPLLSYSTMPPHAKQRHS
ncbi:hypothetical protein L6164_014039 [Bauhinia variegata]|uniref:Uncharacterized protein n=1 Tax=Bauhinia variegata TaxID=167791 RepID=A0ACB9NHS6_BAUVA|nr:hypothetical protein L6164_014039 [Bauhinia variegata]